MCGVRHQHEFWEVGSGPQPTPLRILTSLFGGLQLDQYQYVELEGITLDKTKDFQSLISG